MSDQLIRWNERYAAKALEGPQGLSPSPLLTEAITALQPGVALDLACGAGRHVLYLAGRSWRVVGVDGSSVSVGLMMTDAQRLGLASRIEPVVADLEADPPPPLFSPDSYDLICDFYYLHRPLFAALRCAIRPGGLLVAAIHTVDPDAAHPMNPAFLLAPGELVQLVQSWGWDVLHTHEGHAPDESHHRASAQLVARRPVP